ncbi:peptidase inhibitor family I36 protein [Microbispora sp. ZYX-F-249]|uniref:Peptidase inhibitor family I36 protein n=1 Tax=Microbispora maris TaxID=3144104 RepID=A0ABV0ARD8_9ACTN
MGKRVQRIRLLATGSLAAGGLILTAAAPASATRSASDPTTSPAAADSKEKSSLLHRQARSDAELREQVALQLKIAPGGIQTSRNEVSYDNGRFVVTYALPQQVAAGTADCPSGWFCFYDGANFGYPRGKLSSCWWQDLATYGWSDRTSSVDNGDTNAIGYINHDDGGNPANGHSDDDPLFWDQWNESIAYLAPDHNNKADHVYRYC